VRLRSTAVAAAEEGKAVERGEDAGGEGRG
jgi:hypothetical protein